MKHYFDCPKQVVFADPENLGEWLCGIAFHDSVICSCCGGVFEIADVLEAATENEVVNPFYEYKDWSDITNDICGDALPEGLVFNGDSVEEIVKSI